jgi:hypothetical protein
MTQGGDVLESRPLTVGSDIGRRNIDDRGRRGATVMPAF